MGMGSLTAHHPSGKARRAHHIYVIEGLDQREADPDNLHD